MVVHVAAAPVHLTEDLELIGEWLSFVHPFALLLFPVIALGGHELSSHEFSA